MLKILGIFLRYFTQDFPKIFKTYKFSGSAALSFKLDHCFLLGLIGSQARNIEYTYFEF